MENPESNLKIPNQLCQEIFNCQFELDIGNITEQIISKTIQLYSEAMNYFIAQKDQSLPIKKRIQFYQDKIKRLLSRKDVEKCLVGKKVSQRSIDIDHELAKVKQSAPEQAKALIQHYKNVHAHQQKLIERTMEDQNSKLSQRIAKRSRSKSDYRSSPKKEEQRKRLASIVLVNVSQNSG